MWRFEYLITKSTKLKLVVLLEIFLTILKIYFSVHHLWKQSVRTFLKTVNYIKQPKMSYLVDNRFKTDAFCNKLILFTFIFTNINAADCSSVNSQISVYQQHAFAKWNEFWSAVQTKIKAYCKKNWRHFSENQFQDMTWKKNLLNVLISVRSAFISLRQEELYGRSATSWYSGFPRKGCKSTQKKYVKTPLVAEPEPCWSGNKNGTIIWRVFFSQCARP